jgi:hypothetical protein
MTAPTPLPQTVSLLEEVACTFIDIHLDTVAKRDLAVWFVEHPNGQYTAADLSHVLGHERSNVATGLQAMQEAVVIVPVKAQGQRAWRFTPDPATSQILKAVARYFHTHPGTRTTIVHHASA